jgi:hypothetical protein
MLIMVFGFFFEAAVSWSTSRSGSLPLEADLLACLRGREAIATGDDERGAELGVGAVWDDLKKLAIDDCLKGFAGVTMDFS